MSPPSRSVRRLLAASLGVVLGASIPPLLRADRPDVRGHLLAPAKAATGSRVPIVVELAIGSGWHVNSHAPAEKFLIPTDVALTATAGRLSPVHYPPDVETRPSFADKPMRVYEGTVRFESLLELPETAGETAVIHATVAYQACNERQCYPPSKIPLEASISITPAR